MGWIKELFADAKGVADDARIGAFMLILTFCVATIYSLYKGQPWEANNFGIGAGALCAGVGALFGLRKEQ